MPEGQEGPGKKPENPFSRLKTRLGRLVHRNPTGFNRNTTLEEQLRASGMKTAEPQLTTAEQARRNRAEEIRNRREELSRARGKYGLKPSWGNIEKITYDELIAKGELEEAERYRATILRDIENKGKK